MKTMRENWADLNAPIQEEVLSKLPAEPIGFNKDMMIVATVLETDMDRKEVPAVICIWRDTKSFMPGIRKAYFALETGNYIGDAFLL